MPQNHLSTANTYIYTCTHTIEGRKTCIYMYLPIGDKNHTYMCLTLSKAQTEAKAYIEANRLSVVESGRETLYTGGVSRIGSDT